MAQKTSEPRTDHFNTATYILSYVCALNVFRIRLSVATFLLVLRMFRGVFVTKAAPRQHVTQRQPRLGHVSGKFVLFFRAVLLPGLEEEVFLLVRLRGTLAGAGIELGVEGVIGGNFVHVAGRLGDVREAGHAGRDRGVVGSGAAYRVSAVFAMRGVLHRVRK